MRETVLIEAWRAVRTKSPGDAGSAIRMGFAAGGIMVGAAGFEPTTPSPPVVNWGMHQDERMCKNLCKTDVFGIDALPCASVHGIHSVSGCIQMGTGYRGV